MTSDYIEEQVLHAMSKRVSDLMPDDRPLALINTVNLLPLGPLACGCLAYPSIAFYDGLLKHTDPLTVSSSQFSHMYLTLLQNTYLDDPIGSEDKHQLKKQLAERQTQAIVSISSPSLENGGVCAGITDSTPALCSYVPAFEATWVQASGSGPLSIDIDAWRPDPAEKWQQGRPPIGKTGERLRAHLQYSDIRICLVAPKALSDQVGWYDAEFVEGMKNGNLGNVLFNRFDGFPDITDFRRAAAFVVVGSVQFDLNSDDSNVDLTQSLESVKALSSAPLMPASRIRISSHLSVPLMDTDPNDKTIRSHWDSGDCYALYNAGLVIGAAIDAPFTT